MDVPTILGMPDASTSAPDLSRMTASRGLFIGDMVREARTETVATIAIVMREGADIAGEESAQAADHGIVLALVPVPDDLVAQTTGILYGPLSPIQRHVTDHRGGAGRDRVADP